MCELHSDPVWEKTVIPNLVARFKWLVCYLGESRKAFVHYDCEAVANFPRLEASGLATPNTMFEACEELVLVDLCYP
jgi:hypothetical protein